MPHTNVVSVSSSASSMSLLAGEQVIFRSRPSFLIPLFFILFIWTVAGLFLWIILKSGVLNQVPFVSPMIFEIIYLAALGFVGLAIFLSWLNTEYILTSERVESRFGIFGEKTISIALENIENIVLSASIIGRIFNYGDIKIEPAGLTTSIKFGGIPDAETKKEQIEDAIGP